MSERRTLLPPEDALRLLIKVAREHAEEYGSLHSWWDVIFDAEAVMDMLVERHAFDGMPGSPPKPA